MAHGGVSRIGQIPATSWRPEVVAVGREYRWTWCSFDHQPQLWNDAVRGAERVADRALIGETYLASEQSTSSVKLRDDHVEVKRLVCSSDDGLQLWHQRPPYLFPLVARDVAELLEDLKAPRPTVAPVLPTPEHLLSYILRAVPGTRPISVRKWVRMYRIQHCEVERSTVLVGGHLLDTLKFTATDAGALRDALRASRLDTGWNNASCVAGFLRRTGSSPGG